MREKKKFLIIRLGALGDIIHALPVADAIKTYYKNSQVDWVVGDKFIDLIKNNPSVDNFYVANLSVWRKNWLSPSTFNDIKNLDDKLKAQKYDYSIDAHGMFKSLVVQAFCGAEKRVGYKDYREFAPLGSNILVEPKAKRPYINYHVIKRQLDLLEGAKILTPEELKNYTPKAYLPERSPETVEKVKELLKNIDKKKPIVVFAPATTWGNKHWDEKNWQNLFQMLKGEVNIIFSGIKKDLPLIKRITQGQEAFVLAGKTNLEEYIELLNTAKVIVSPDSSASHIAFALNLPKAVTIFCATSKHTFSPPGHISLPLEEQKCTPCHKRKCRKKNCTCTSQVSADEVYLCVKKLLNK